MTYLLTWSFDAWVNWKLHKSFILPNNPKVTAVIGIILDDINQVFLAKNQRWWDLPGWHTENDETPEETLIREVSEEAWTNIHPNVILWWYREVTSDKPIPNRDGWFYPQRSHILYYQWQSQWDLYKPYWEEILESRAFDIQEAIHLAQNDVDKFILKDIQETL